MNNALLNSNKSNNVQASKVNSLTMMTCEIAKLTPLTFHNKNHIQHLLNP